MTHQPFHKKDVLISCIYFDNYFIENELSKLELAFYDDQIFRLDSFIDSIFPQQIACRLFGVVPIKIRHLIVLLNF